MNSARPFRGHHWLVEFTGASGLANVEYVRKSLQEAVAAASATLLRIELHHFGPGFGVAGMALLAESHVSIHTWPEHCYAAIDLFMCGATASPDRALASLEQAFRPTRIEVRRFVRGFDGGCRERVAEPGDPSMIDG